MTFIVIIICIAVQHYLKFTSYSYHIDWVEPYYHWMVKKIEMIKKNHPLLGFAILMIPLLLMISFLFMVVYHLLGVIGYFLLSLIFVWYCMDARDLKTDPYPGVKPTDLFILTYQNLFAIIFWYAIFGPIGLAIYYLTKEFRIFFEEEIKGNKKLHDISVKVQGVLDWVPIRLLGLTYALVGHFSMAFKALLKDVLAGISDDLQLIATWGKAALEFSSQKKPSSTQSNEIIGIIYRALSVWLVAIALLSIAFWLG